MKLIRHTERETTNKILNKNVVHHNEIYHNRKLYILCYVTN